MGKSPGLPAGLVFSGFQKGSGAGYFLGDYASYGTLARPA